MTGMEPPRQPPRTGRPGLAPHPLHSVTPERAAQAIGTRLHQGIDSWAELARALTDEDLVGRVEAAGRALISALAAGSSLLVAGNGGSAAIASHVAAEFVGKCIHDRDPLPALSLAESLSSITAVGNDYGYEHVFTRGLLAHGRPGDVLLAMSTSGTSANIVAALQTARARGVVTIALTGSGGAVLEGQVDHLLVVPSAQTPRIQEVHMLWTHAWCEAIDVVCQPGG